MSTAINLTWRPKCGDALRLRIKGSSFRSWISVWVAGKTEWFLVNTCHSERFGDEYTHEKALYKCPVLILVIIYRLHHYGSSIAPTSGTSVRDIAIIHTIQSTGQQQHDNKTTIHKVHVHNPKFSELFCVADWILLSIFIHREKSAGNKTIKR